MIIGLAGYARVGKDAAAKVLVEEYGFTRVAFADKLREAVYALNPIVVANAGHDYAHLQYIIDNEGWGGYKEGDYSEDIRRVLQRMGTEVGRDLLGNNIWVDATIKNLPEGDVVITDVRFTNEADAIKRMPGGEVWRVYRNDVGPANNHPSETAIDNWTGYSRYIFNRGDLNDYENQIRKVLAQYRLS